ncbi:MAG: hypothetical protein H5T74_14615 [Actinobacteria bacterium]|nr:hypothetical protein [Actinomycetota bacterium]
MLPMDIAGRRLCLAADQLLACVGEALLLSRRMREAAEAGDAVRVTDLAAETARMAEETKAAGRELLASAETGSPPGAAGAESFLERMARMDSDYGTDLSEKMERFAEMARALAVEQAANVSLLSALAVELERFTSWLMNITGGWVIYGGDGAAVTDGGGPRRVSFSV